MRRAPDSADGPLIRLNLLDLSDRIPAEMISAEAEATPRSGAPPAMRGMRFLRESAGSTK